MNFFIHEDIKKICKVFTACIVLLFVFFSFYKPLEFEDGWWHLATGRWIVQNNAVPHQDPFPFTDKPAPWILTQWLGSTIFYLVHAASGIAGLKFFRFFVFFLSITIFILFSRKKISLLYQVILTFFLVQILAGGVLIRPMIFNFLFIQLFLIILLHYEKTRDHKKLFWIVPLGALWSNLHLGSFVYGTTLISVFLFASCVEYANFLIGQKTFRYSRDHAKPIINLLYVLLLFWLSLGISPYGMDALIYPWKVFVFPKFIHFYQTLNVVQEMQPPRVLTFAFFWFDLLLGLIFFSLFLSLKRLPNKLTILLLTILSLFFLLFASRGAEFATILIAYVLVLTFSREKDTNIQRAFALYQKILFFLIMATMTLVCYDRGSTSLKANTPQGQTIFSAYESGDHQKAIKLLGSLEKPNRVFCNDNLGSYLTWKLYPRSKPFVDGRQVDKHMFFEQFLPFLHNPTTLWYPLDTRYNFQVVFLELRDDAYTILARYLTQHPQWKLVLIDGWDVLFIKKSFADLTQDAALKDADNTDLTADEKEHFNQILVLQVPRHSAILTQQRLFYKDLAEATIFFNCGFQNFAIRKIIKLNNTYPREKEIKRIAKLFAFVLDKEKNISPEERP